METASILPLVFNDGRGGSEHLSRAYCEAQRSRTMLSIFLSIPWRAYEVFDRPKRLQSARCLQRKGLRYCRHFLRPKTGQVTFAPQLTEAQRVAFRDSLMKPSQSETQDSLRMQRDWIQRIMNRYSASPTAIVLTPVPRGPFAGLPGASMTFHAAFPTITSQKTVFSLPEQTFDFLEKPEYYFDGFHLNSKGRHRFTETLVTELIGRLRSANSNGRVHSDSGPVTGASRQTTPAQILGESLETV